MNRYEALPADVRAAMENRFMWAAATGPSHPDATAEKAVETIVSPLLDQLTGAVGAGDALADAVSDIMADDPESVLHTWVRRWHEAAHPGGR
jgi:hypothetical protein